MKTYYLGYYNEYAECADTMKEDPDGEGDWVKAEDHMAWRKDALELIEDMRRYASACGQFRRWDAAIARLKG